MKEQVVSFYTTERIQSVVYVEDRFSFRKDRGWILIQRAAFWLLRKIGCYAPITTETIKRHTLKADSLIEMIHREHNELLMYYNERCERLLIGPDEYRQLVDGELYGRFSISVPYRRMTNDCKLEICNMKVTFIPWMKGILAVPKEDRL